MIEVRNIFLFVFLATVKGISPFKWQRYYHAIKAAHLAQIRKTIWKLKKEGKIYEDKQGRLWPKK